MPGEVYRLLLSKTIFASRKTRRLLYAYRRVLYPWHDGRRGFAVAWHVEANLPAALSEASPATTLFLSTYSDCSPNGLCISFKIYEHINRSTKGGGGGHSVVHWLFVEE